MKRKITSVLIIIIALLFGCAYTPRDRTNMQTLSQEKIKKDSEDRYREEARKNADKYKLTEYRFLGVALFEPFDSSGYTYVDINKNGHRLYKLNMDTEVFPERHVSIDEKGIALTVHGRMAFKSKNAAVAFRQMFVETIRQQFPLLRETDESEELYLVTFHPREKYIDKYVSHEIHSDSNMRIKSIGYKSAHYYFGNFMPDEKLDMLMLSTVREEGKWYLLFYAQSRQASEASTLQMKKEKEEISKQFYSAYKPKEVRKEKGFNIGTAFFVHDEGYLITNFHVIEGANDVFVYSNGKAEKVDVIAVSEEHDFALLKIDRRGKAIPLAGCKQSGKATEVMTIGYPLIQLQGQAQKATFGRINALSGAGDDARYYQIDVPIQPGNSGGPLIVKEGCAIGVATATLDQVGAMKILGSLPQNVNYAVKVDEIINMLRRKGLEISHVSNKGEKSFNDLILDYEASVVMVISK